MPVADQKRAAKKNSDEGLPLFLALSQLSPALLSNQDLDQILTQAVRQIKKIFKVKSCGIFLLNDKGILEFRKGLGLSKRFQKTFDSRVSPKLTRRILNRIYPKISNDTLVDYNKNKSLRDLMRRENIHKEIGVPFKVKNKLIGILNIGRDSTYPDFLERDLRLLNMFGSQIAIATGNAKLHPQLKRSSEVYGNLIEGSPDSIVAVDLKGNITYCNKATEILTGYAKEELVGKHFSRVGSMENKEIYHSLKLFKALRSGKKVAPFEMQVRHKNGKPYWIEVHVSRIKAKGKVIGFQVNTRDITERRQVEESSKQKVLELNSFINNIPDMAWLKDAKSRFIALNKAFGEVAAMKPETLIGQTCEACFGAKAGKKFREDDLKVMKGRKQVSIEEKILDSKGNELWLETIKSPIFSKLGEVVGTVGISRNVTERKRIEKALIQKEQIARERARLLTDLRSLDRIDDILTRVCEAVRDSGLFERAVMTLHKPKGRIVHLGQVGLPSNVVKRARQAPPIDNKLRSRITNKKFRISDSFFIPAEAGVDFSKTGRYIPQKRKNSTDGGWQSGDELFVPLRDFSGKIMGYLSVDTPTDGSRPDVETIQALEMLVEAAAARVREVEAREALKRERNLSQSILETANSLIVCLDADAKITVFNQECERVTGYRREEVLGKRWPELFLPSDQRHAGLKSFAKWVRAHPRDQYEGPIVTKSGEIRTILWSNTFILGSDKKDVVAIAIGQDITERKRTEETLQISQERYKLSTKAANVGVWDWNIKTNKFYIDPNVKEILGYKDEEIPNDIEVWVTYVHPDDREPVMAAAQACLDGKTPEYVFEHRMIHKDGSVRWILSRGSVIRDAKGNALRMVGTDTDITERKRAEEKLKESEEKYRKLVETSGDMIFTVDLKGNFLFTNKAFEKDLGYSDEEIKKINGFRLVHSQDLKRVKEQFAQLVKGKSVDNMEYRYKTKDGSYINILNNASPIFNPQGNVVAAFGIARDITERKQMEKELRQSREFLKTVIDNIPNPIFIKDRKHTWVVLNKAVSDMIGHPIKKMLGKSDYDFFPKMQADFFWKKDQEMFRTGETVDIPEEPITDAKGKIHYLHTKKSPLRDSSGHITHLVGITEEITERKRAEEALRESEERYRSLSNDVLNSSKVGMFILDKNFHIVGMNRALELYFGLQKADVIGKNKRKLIRERIKDMFEDPNAFAQKVLTTYDNNAYIENFECLVLPGGKRKKRWLEHWSQPIRSGLYAGGRIEHYYDITERKRVDEALRQSEKKYRTLVETAQEGIGITDPEENIRFMNQAFADMLGYEKEELLGKNLTQISNEEEFAKFRKETQKRKQGKSSKYETELFTKNSKPKYFHVSAVPIRAQNGRFEGTLAVLTDITEIKRAREQNLLLETSKALSRTLKLNQVLKIAAEKMAKALRADRCSVALLDKSADSAEIKHVFIKKGSPSPILPDKRTPPEEHFPQVKESLMAKGYLQIRNADTDPMPASVRSYFRRAGIKSSLIIPLIVDKKLFGVFHIGNVKKFRSFTSEEISLAQTIANQIGIAIQNALLIEDLKKKHSQIREQSKTLERQYQEQSILMKISRELSQTLDLDRILEIATKEAAQALQVDRCAVSLAFPEEGYAEIRSIYVKGRKPITHLLGYRLYAHNFPQAKEMFEKRKLINIPNIYHLPDKSFAKEYFIREGIKSALFVPMVHGKKLVGFFTLSTMKDFKTFTREETKLAQTIADQVAVALENAKLLELVKKNSEDLKTLSTQLINVQEDERKKFAQELHDEIGQTLFAMKMNLEMSKKSLPPNLEEFEDIKNRLSDTENLLSQTIDRIRSLTTDLRPSMLDDFGLIPALKWYIDNFSKRTNIEVYLKTKIFEPRLSSEVETTLYRILQEALTNVAKHAKATQVSIMLARENSTVSLSVEDNGIGFDAKKATFPKDKLGLFSIKERVKLLNGEFKIGSKPNKGTKLNVKIPLTEERV